jgi:hypothetical protein
MVMVQQPGPEVSRRAQVLREVIDGADARDQAAEIRERTAESRSAAAALRAEHDVRDDVLDESDRAHAAVDRWWAGADRDASAIDRATLRDGDD